MADIKLLLNNYGHDMDQDDDDYSDCSKYIESVMVGQTNPDDLLSPLEKLRKYCTSDNVFTRQMVARSIIETVQSIQNQQECLSLLEIITELAEDFEPSVRCELMEQLPPCSLMIMDMRLVPGAIPAFILPVMVKNLADPSNQVRKLSQNALLQLIDQEMIAREEVERQICPVLLTLTEPDSGDDLRTEAVALLTKIAPLVGNEATERSFLKRFGDLCADPLFHVRKVCASNFGDMVSVLRQETIEEHLIPLFARLCEDGVWGVRKACAETFMAVSGTCSLNVRYERLSPLFVGLLSDKSRWVQMAAYQALGQFIATFAVPERTGYDVDAEGTLYRCKKAEVPSSLSSSSSDNMPALEDPSLESDRQIIETVGTSSTESPAGSSSTDPISQPAVGSTTTVDDTAEKDSAEKSFNNFEYWRTPLPSVDLPDEIDAGNNGTKEQHSNGESLEQKELTNTSTIPNEEALEQQRSDAVSPRPTLMSNDDEFLHVDPSGSGFHSDSDDDDSSHHNTSTYASSLVDEEHLRSQRIVPSALLEHYISMTETNKIQSIDNELPRHCAFTMPGVVLALGPENWSLLKETYELLSTDMQWKVRRTLAFSIHDLAIILGEEICVKDLVPVFNGFLKDLDEVRIGVLKHLYDFISFLPKDLQKEYLHVYNDFQKTDNMRNWRFRQDLALQLMNLSTLYNEKELAEFLCPVAIDLVCDKVAEVRQHAFHLLCILMRKLGMYGNDELMEKFISTITVLSTQNQHWVKRKACAQIYWRFIEGRWYDAARFSKDFLPSLVALCSDNVPNVRLIAAKAIICFMKTDYFESLPEDDEVRKYVNHSMESLQTDTDRDVRYFSGGQMNDRTSYLVLSSSSHSSHSSIEYMGQIERGIHEYAVHDDDDDSELVEEVYIENSSAHAQAGDLIIEEYYIEETSGNEQYAGDRRNPSQIYVEEIVEEIIETIGSPTVKSTEKR